MGQPGQGSAWSQRKLRQAGELKHLSSPRKRKRSDSVSSGERKRRSLNQVCVDRMQPLHSWG